MGDVVQGQLGTTQPPTNTSRAGYAWASEAFVQQLEILRGLDARLGALEDELEAAGAPWTPGQPVPPSGREASVCSQ